jgi:hypothetical protein
MRHPASVTVILLAATAAVSCGHAEPRPEGEGAARATGQPLAAELLAQWKRDHPERDWVREENEKHVIKKPADNSGLVGQGQGATYGRVTAQDVEIWRRETEKAVAEGSRIFHSADELGSTVAVSCDMCHPDASDTHPETYPKYQVQMGRVALLRDMINWCVQQPVRGRPLDPDGAKMRALEAYILAQRQGEKLDFGRR